MRIVVIGDLHLDAQISGYDCHQDVLDALHEVDFTEADWVVQLGDVADPSGGPRGYRALGAFAEWAGNCCRVPLDVVVGNHDRIDDARASSSLQPIAAHVSVRDRVGLSTPRSCNLLFLPWLSRAHGEVDVAARVAELLDGVTKPVIAFCHLDIEGVLPGGEADLPRLGRQVLPRAVEDDPRIVAVMAGHYHAAQTVRVKTHVVGSLARLGMADREVEKSYSVVTVDGDDVRIERVPVTSRPYHLLSGTPDEVLGNRPDVKGAVVRLDVEVGAHESFDAEALRRSFYEAGAVHVYPIAPRYVEDEVPPEKPGDVDYADVRAALADHARRYPPPKGANVDALLSEVTR